MSVQWKMAKRERKLAYRARTDRPRATYICHVWAPKPLPIGVPKEGKASKGVEQYMLVSSYVAHIFLGRTHCSP